MKYYPLALLAVCAFAQQRTTYTYDVNGNPVRGVSSLEQKAPGTAEKRQTTANVNGRRVPIEDVEERVVSDDGRVRVTERLVRRYTPNGDPGPTEKTRIEERKNPDGSASATATTWRGDLNGNMQIAERSVSETRKSGDATATTTVVERPSLNGSMDLAERREELNRKPSASAESNTLTILRKDANGRLEQTGRTTVERTTENGTSVENQATYELGQLVRQTVTRSAKTPAGEQVEQDVFVADAAGKVRSPQEARPQLLERRLIERTYRNDGSMDRVSVQMPSASDPGRLSQPRFVEEIVCTGPCRPNEPKPQP